MKNNPTPLTKEQLEEHFDAVVRIIANSVYGFNGSDPTNPPISVIGKKYAIETLKEVLELHKAQAIKQERSRVVEMIEPKYNEAIQALHTEFPPKFMAGGGEVGRIVPQREQRLQLEIAVYGNLLEALKEQFKTDSQK